MSIEEFFNGKHIFITGVSGFIGKALIEKLLRSCDGIEKIYVLIRNKKNKTPAERLQIIFDGEPFSKLKKLNPSAIKKVVPICGNISELKLGLSDEDIQCLIDNIDIIYHAAASVRFDEHLKDSILLNTRGTRELTDIALRAKKLVTFIHISTAYCISHKKFVEEKLYPAHADWRDMIKLAEEIDQHTLNIFSQKIINPLINTYTYAKSLAEHVVEDQCKGKVLAAIARPSIVVSSTCDPVAGWIDNFNGPMGLLVGGGKGLLKISYGDINTALDCIPVDLVVKFLILIAYEKTLSMDKNEVTVYNTTCKGQIYISHNDLVTLGAKLTWDVPYSKILWYPSFSMTNNVYWYYFTFLLYQVFPAFFFDGLLKLYGIKPMIFRFQKKIYVANMVVSYFMLNTWTFVNDKCLSLGKHIPESELQKFSFAHYLKLTTEDLYAMCIRGKIGVAKYLFKEEFNLKKGYRVTTIFLILDKLVHLLVLGILCWFIFVKVKIVSIFTNFLNTYILYLHDL